MQWRRLSHEAIKVLDSEELSKIFVARRHDGKCCVGYIQKYNSRSITVGNGNHQVTLWYNDPRMFTLLKIPALPEVRVADPELKLG